MCDGDVFVGVGHEYLACCCGESDGEEEDAADEAEVDGVDGRGDEDDPEAEGTLSEEDGEAGVRSAEDADDGGGDGGAECAEDGECVKNTNALPYVAAAFTDDHSHAEECEDDHEPCEAGHFFFKEDVGDDGGEDRCGVDEDGAFGDADFVDGEIEEEDGDAADDAAEDEQGRANALEVDGFGDGKCGEDSHADGEAEECCFGGINVVGVADESRHDGEDDAGADHGEHAFGEAAHGDAFL